MVPPAIERIHRLNNILHGPAAALPPDGIPYSDISDPNTD
jgi:hypothetical protein